jgi:segregation and condensation protein B
MVEEPNTEQLLEGAEPEAGEPIEREEPASAEAGAEGSIEETGAFLKGLIEALIFVSDRPLELKEVARGARIDRARAAELIEEIRKEYEGKGLRLDEVGGGYTFRSSPVYAERVRQYLALRPVRLSRAQLETLAIVAYRQPITRPEIDDVRGVDSGPVLKGLLERDLVRIIGKKDEPGRPMLYGTTPSFLEAFSLKSLRDLPTLREYTELSEESRQTFESELGEAAPEGSASAYAAALGPEADVPASDAEAGDAEAAEDGAPGDAAETAQPAASTEKGDASEVADGDGEDDDDEDDDDDDEDDDDDADEDDEDDDDDDDDDDEDDDDDDEDDDDDDEEKKA